jgi:hypothetical protein
LFGDFTIGSVCLEKQKRREKAEEEIEYGKRVFGLVSLRRRRFGAEGRETMYWVSRVGYALMTNVSLVN